MQLSFLLAIGAGGFIGAILRFIISVWIQKFFPFSFPIGTLIVNILGSFVIGFAALCFENIDSYYQKAFIVTGLLGAFTTFSTFSIETVTMLQDGLYGKAFVNVIFNTSLCILATIVGMMFFKRIL